MLVRTLRSVVTFLALSLLLLFSPLASRAEKVEDLPKPTNWVADFAHVLSPATAQQLDTLCGQLSHSKANAQIEIVTIRSLDGDDIEDFTSRLEEKWKIGKKGSDRGVVMLFAIQDHKRRIEVGFGLEGILPDAKVGDIGRSMVPDLRAGNYDGAITTGTVEIANVIAADSGISLNSSPDQGQTQSMPRRARSSGIGLIFRIILIILVLVFLGARGLFGFGLGMLFGGGGRWGGGGGGGWGGGDGGGGGGFDGSGGGESGGGGASGDW